MNTLRYLIYYQNQPQDYNSFSQLDAEDESLTRWKASLGLTGASNAPTTGPKVCHRKMFNVYMFIVVALGYSPLS